MSTRSTLCTMSLNSLTRLLVTEHCEKMQMVTCCHLVAVVLVQCGKLRRDAR